jgi:hypothetical protein
MLNIHSILDDNGMFSKVSEEKKFYLRSFQFCSNQFVRNIVTSDIEYNVTTFPKELSLKIKKGENWYKQYEWLSIGKSEDDPPSEERPPTKSLKPKRPKSVLRQSIAKGKNDTSKSKSNKRVAFTLDRNEIRKDIGFNGNKENNKDLSNLHEERKSLKKLKKGYEMEDHKSIEAELSRVRDNSSLIERTKYEIDEIKRQYEIELYGKPSDDFKVHNNEKLLFVQHPDPHGSDNPDDVFLLRPDPIMRLNQCIGSHPKYNSQSVLFHRNQKYGNDVVYGSANMIISMNTKSMKQKFLFDHPDQVKKITMTSEFIISVSKPGEGNNEKVKKKKKFNKTLEDREIQVIVWDVHTGSNIISFKPPLDDICDLYVSLKNTYLVIIGKDYQGRDVILAYNFPDLVKFAKVDLVTRQLSDFPINTIKSNPINDTMFISGGKESIRFWKIKEAISGANVTLNKIGRGKVFTQILYDYEFYGDGEQVVSRGKNKPLGKIHCVWVGTACGHLFQINYSSRDIEQVIKIHEDRITSLEMTNDRRYKISSSLDGTIRLFTNDFSQ